MITLESLKSKKFEKFETTVLDDLHFVVGGKDKETIPSRDYYPNATTDAFTTGGAGSSYDGFELTGERVSNDGFDF